MHNNQHNKTQNNFKKWATCKSKTLNLDSDSHAIQGRNKRSNKLKYGYQIKVGAKNVVIFATVQQ